MKVLKIHGKEDIRVEEAPMPEPAEGEVRVRMAYGGICGSDLHYYFHGASGVFVLREPLTPGHEMSATVDLDPSGDFAPGTPVTIAPATHGEPQPGLEDRPHLWPGGAYYGSASTTPHTQGGMAEYKTVPASMLRLLPDGLDLRTAALAEPLSVALHAAGVAGDLSGASVLVIGCGPIGLCVVAAALARGAASVDASDMLGGPLERAAGLGAAATYPAAAGGVPQTHYDVVFECSGVAPAISSAIGAARRAGVVVQVGNLPNEPIAVNLGPMVSKELEYRATFRFNDEMDEAVALLASRPELGQIVTHVIDADDAERAFAVARDAQASGKVLVSLWGEE
ncbi:L-idonate 5-dehydrogenase [Propioniciclava soli]|uniref:L-idonate 5-dehydrogenase n=1 Tax=Propioniciclava soli TaxID=2775081 RepID=UPI001E346E2F